MYFFFFFFLFLLKTVYETQLIYNEDLLKIFNFLVKNGNLTSLKKTSSNLHESQELSGPLPIIEN